MQERETIISAVEGSDRKFWPNCFLGERLNAARSVLGDVMRQIHPAALPTISFWSGIFLSTAWL